jgi:putative acetyltransferase
MLIRAETPSDRSSLRGVHARAFGQAAEADLVDRLRRDGDLLLSLAAVEDRLVGHVVLSRLRVEQPGLRAAALAPLAVLPERQRQGIGSALVREALGRLAAAGEHLVIVLGDPAYYGRFGFAPEAVRALRTPYDGPALQGLALGPDGRGARGRVRYAPAFAELP